MKNLKHLLLFEANKKKPSGIGKIKDRSYEEEVEYIAGDIYDLSGDNRYKEKFKYYKGDGNGYIMDKDGNYYDVNTSSWSGDAGRIAGGSMYYRVVINNVKGQKLIFNGYSAIFSTPSHASIVIDIKNGMYLEDFIAKHWFAMDCEKKADIEELKDKGDANAKTYETEKKETAEQKKTEFFERYLVLPNNISFTIVDGEMEFHYWNPAKRKDRPKSSWELNRRDFDSDEAYEEAKKIADGNIKEYEEKYKKLDKEIQDLFKPFCIKKLKELFKTDMNNLNGLEFGVKPSNTDYRNKIALDTKDKKLVVLSDQGKSFSENWKLNKEAIADIELFPVATISKSKASEFLTDLFKRASDAYIKMNKRQKTKYIEDHWKDYFSWYRSEGKTDIKGEARKRAESKFLQDLADHTWDNSNKISLAFDVVFLKDFIDDNVPVDTESPKNEEQPKTDKGEKKAPAFTGKLAEQEKKMDAWHEGTRNQNVSSCSDAKLKVNYDICVKKGYEKEAAILKKEADARGLTLESLDLSQIKKTINDYIELI